MRRGRKPVEISDLEKIAERHAKGERIEDLAAEVGVSRSTLYARLGEADLFAPMSMQDGRWRDVDRVADRVPQEEVVRRYEGGESIVDIVAYLRELGFSANWYWVESVLDRHQVVRRSKSPTPTELCRAAVAGRHQELADRVLEGEPVRKVAEELGVDHNVLARELKRTGHLPDVNLARYLAKKRMQGRSLPGGHRIENREGE
jgi:hypothetical protein